MKRAQHYTQACGAGQLRSGRRDRHMPGCYNGNRRAGGAVMGVLAGRRVVCASGRLRRMRGTESLPAGEHVGAP